MLRVDVRRHIRAFFVFASLLDTIPTVVTACSGFAGVSAHMRLPWSAIVCGVYVSPFRVGSLSLWQSTENSFPVLTERIAQQRFAVRRRHRGTWNTRVVGFRCEVYRSPADLSRVGSVVFGFFSIAAISDYEERSQREGLSSECCCVGQEQVKERVPLYRTRR